MYLALLASVAEMDTIPRSGASAIAEPADSPTATIAAPIANFVMVFLPAICFAQPTKPDEPFRPTFAFVQAKMLFATGIASAALDQNDGIFPSPRLFAGRGRVRGRRD